MLNASPPRLSDALVPLRDEIERALRRASTSLPVGVAAVAHVGVTLAARALVVDVAQPEVLARLDHDIAHASRRWTQRPTHIEPARDGPVLSAVVTRARRTRSPALLRSWQQGVRSLAHYIDGAPQSGDPGDALGWALWGLGCAGVTTRARRIDKCVERLRSRQADAGCWGDPTRGYLATTSVVALGLEGVAVPSHQPFLGIAMDWLAMCQNEDGGFGERTPTHEGPAAGGVGPSQIGATAIVLACLSGSATRYRGACLDAIRWLLAQQTDDGSWPVADRGALAVIALTRCAKTEPLTRFPHSLLTRSTPPITPTKKKR
ncbi:MAG: prenyltransferase/squalene oxidase repeat-containing protein [Myxococcota bacterium]